MKKPNFSSFLKKSSININSNLVFWVLTIITLVIRFPFFFRDFINRDESTFILMGQSWVDGNLPYTELWDLKPPLVFLFFASIIYLFGKSFIAIRLVGTLIIAISSFLLYHIGVKIHSKKTGFWMAILYIYTSSLFGNVQGVMSEHLSMFFFLSAFLILLKETNFTKIFFAGFFFGCALLMKLNLSFSVLFCGIIFFINTIRQQNIKKALYFGSILGLSSVIPFLLIYLPYYLKGLDKLFFDSVFLAPLAYCVNNLKDKFAILIPIVILALISLSFTKWHFKKKTISIYPLALTLASITGVLYSFFKVGKINGHYLLQFYPFLIILIIPFLVYQIKLKKEITTFVIIVLMLLLPIESYKEYAYLGKRILNHKELLNGEGIEIPEYLNTQIKSTDKILFLEFHIGNWMLNKNPLTKILTHPSNIKRDKLYQFYNTPRKNCKEELSYILETIKPEFIITQSNARTFLKDNPKENTYFKNYLKNNYSLNKTIGVGEVYKLNEEHLVTAISKK